VLNGVKRRDLASGTRFGSCKFLKSNSEGRTDGVNASKNERAMPGRSLLFV